MIHKHEKRGQNFVLRLHALVAIAYAIPLIFYPQLVLKLLYYGNINALSGELAKLFGAQLLLLSIVAWHASYSNDFKTRRYIILGLCIYTLSGFVITLIGQLNGTWASWGWTNIIEYAFFGFIYLYYLVRKI